MLFRSHAPQRRTPSTSSVLPRQPPPPLFRLAPLYPTTTPPRGSRRASGQGTAATVGQETPIGEPLGRKPTRRTQQAARVFSLEGGGVEDPAGSEACGAAVSVSGSGGDLWAKGDGWGARFDPAPGREVEERRGRGWARASCPESSRPGPCLHEQRRGSMLPRPTRMTS